MRSLSQDCGLRGRWSPFIRFQNTMHAIAHFSPSRVLFQIIVRGSAIGTRSQTRRLGWLPLGLPRSKFLSVEGVIENVTPVVVRFRTIPPGVHPVPLLRSWNLASLHVLRFDILSQVFYS